jgi:tRNA dimethylallyltransferase
MFKAGLDEEVRALFDIYGADAPGMRAIGYREFFLNGQFREDLTEVESLIVKNTRHYAKRQITYFLSIPDVVWADADNAGEVIKKYAISNR